VSQQKESDFWEQLNNQRASLQDELEKVRAALRAFPSLQSLRRENEALRTKFDEATQV